ncbi:MAG TPA: class I SAM-dependent methyltransferase [Solirubrobacteraceae bacterium]|nr:class I SAM-dependent methyltransferase [Solirubrobacteraceae bacterium]
MDPEAEPAWLERLYSLNAVLVAGGEQLAGSICYEHHQEDYERTPPVAANKEKRERFREACIGRERMLEIGVNGGHSAYVALSANPTLEFHGVDIADHSYVRPAVEWLQNEFPGRVHFHPGSCLDVLPELARQGAKFDLFHVDGAKHTYYFDILNCRLMIDEDRPSLVIVDDANMGPVQQIWARCLRQGLINASDGFPPMSGPRRNAIGILEPIPIWRWRAYRTAALLRRKRRRWRAAVAAGVSGRRAAAGKPRAT